MLLMRAWGSGTQPLLNPLMLMMRSLWRTFWGVSGAIPFCAKKPFTGGTARTPLPGLQNNSPRASASAHENNNCVIIIINIISISFISIIISFIILSIVAIIIHLI